MLMQKIQDLSGNAMLGFLNTVERSARFIVDLADLLRILDANLSTDR
jgi:hypothetical protein